MRDVAVILTTYNRPTLVADAIASVREQDCDRWHLIIMDDGSGAKARGAISNACGPGVVWHNTGAQVADGVLVHNADNSIIWWRGPQRTLDNRRASIPYSRTINIALNAFVAPHAPSTETFRYVTYLCDDDWLMPSSIRERAEHLDAARLFDHVCYGRLRSVQYDASGMNVWTSSTAPKAGRHWSPPDGPRVYNPEERNARQYYLHGGTDPETGLGYAEEGFWLPGVMRYGTDGACDHNQVMHSVECLRSCYVWSRHMRPDGSIEFWGEDNRHGVGDASFFDRLGHVHHFHGVDCWAVTKRYSSKSMGCGIDEVRE